MGEIERGNIHNLAIYIIYSCTITFLYTFKEVRIVSLHLPTLESLQVEVGWLL